MENKPTLKELVKIELKTFGCQWDLIGDTNPEEIAEESAVQIHVSRKDVSNG